MSGVFVMVPFLTEEAARRALDRIPYIGRVVPVTEPVLEAYVACASREVIPNEEKTA